LKLLIPIIILIGVKNNRSLLNLRFCEHHKQYLDQLNLI
jgi:hypothetical protein